MPTPHEHDPVMLTLAALTYRGFQDVLSGDPHDIKMNALKFFV